LCKMTDGHTDMTKLIVAFKKFAKAPKYVLFKHKKIKLLNRRH
jgi:hypothetical protein